MVKGFHFEFYFIHKEVELFEVQNQAKRSILFRSQEDIAEEIPGFLGSGYNGMLGQQGFDLGISGSGFFW